MAGAFLTYEQQVSKLVDEKGLSVADRNRAIECLKRVSYFALVDGYKLLLRNPTTRKYKPGTTFDDIVSLFEFDAELRSLFLSALVRVERKLRSSISYAFCESEGVSQDCYLDPSSYSASPKKAARVKGLVSLLDGLANKNTDYGYIVHQRSKYGNVPLWVLVNAMTFGQVSKMYSLLRPSVKSSVAKQYEHVNERELEQHIKALVLYRNCCAHGERLFSHKIYTDIPDTWLHKKLGIPLNGQQYVMGKRDLFAAVISLRYLLPEDEFVPFKKKLADLMSKFVRENGVIDEAELLASMGFPENWKKLTQYKL